MSTSELPRELGLLDATTIVVGTVVGSAIFVVPNSVAQNLPTPGMIIAVWIIGGALSLLGALGYAELGAMMPATGGQYVYLREAYGPFWAFLCGWAFFLAARSGGTATVAAGFAIYLGYFVPLTPALARIVAAALILVLTGVNYCGIRAGAGLQNTVTALKILGVAILIGSAFLSPSVTPPPVELHSSSEFSFSRFGAAMIACLWAYNGWFAITLVAGEVKNPKRNLPRSLFFGMAIIMLIYLLANFGYLRILSVSELAHADRVAATVAQRTIGSLGATLVSVTILISTLGTVNGNTMTAPRLYFAQARDGLFFRRFGEIHERFRAPSFAVAGQGVWAAILALTGSYEKLFSYATFTFWVFYGMTIVALVILRRKLPELARPYKMWGYPITPWLFAAIAVWFVGNMMLEKPGPSLMGTLILLTGLPAYYMWRWTERRSKGRSLATRPS